MTNIQQGIKYKKKYIKDLTTKQEKYPDSIRDFKRSDDLLKSIHNNGVTNLSVVIIYSTADSIIHAFSSSLRSFDP